MKYPPLFKAAEMAENLGAVASRTLIILNLACVAFIPTFPNNLSGGLLYIHYPAIFSFLRPFSQSYCNLMIFE